ncbi:hypothetical protein [Nocardia sp. NPDC057227]|uniref:hypothetical protein n=1 Tax=Nocardia sp. NPDC057227 TaxID=3346056 RepID=UPI003627929A
MPESSPTGFRLVLRATGTEGPGDGVEVIGEFEETHYGTTEMTVRDPDGRVWNLQAPR